MLDALLEQTRGVVGVALGTDQGELRAIAGSVVDGDASAAVAASVTGELNKVGALLGLGELGVASIKAASTAFVFAQQAGTAVVIEMDPRSQLGELEAKLCSVAWAGGAQVFQPAVNRVPTVPRDGLPVPEHHTPGTEIDLGDLGDEFDPFAGLDAPVIDDRPKSASGLSPLPLPPPPPINTVPRVTRMPSSPGVPTRPTPPPPPVASAPTRPTPPPVTSAPTRPTPLPAAAAAAPSRPTPSPASSSTSMRAATNNPVFTGDLEEFNLPDLLEFLRNTHRTGLLECVGEAGIGTVELSRGMIVAADSPNALDLREHFLICPEIDADRRRALAALPAEYFSDDAIDTMLVARGEITAEDAEAARTARVYSAFREMMAWTSGRFSFDPGVAISSSPNLALSAQSVLMHIFQEQDEQDR
ncbi:MAG TPA: DUF4388 domain-containing protein [Kofleriaceae bacterium]|nr:DUF4388 domain-containing protein [Kofleriaceae bacterium]